MAGGMASACTDVGDTTPRRPRPWASASLTCHSWAAEMLAVQMRRRASRASGSIKRAAAAWELFEWIWKKRQFFGAGETKKNSGRRPLAARSAARGGAKQVRRDKVDFPLRYFAPYFEIAFYLAILGAP